MADQDMSSLKSWFNRNNLPMPSTMSMSDEIDEIEITTIDDNDDLPGDRNNNNNKPKNDGYRQLSDDSATPSKRTKYFEDRSPGSATPSRSDTFSGPPSKEFINGCLDQLATNFPNKDRNELHMALKKENYNVSKAIDTIKSTIRTNRTNTMNAQQRRQHDPKDRVARHETIEVSESESEDEEQYKDMRVVKSGSEDSDWDSDDEKRKRPRRKNRKKLADLSEDQRRVLKFFNKGNPQELLCIAKCSEKKVDNILMLRPFESWHDLLFKVQQSRHLNSDLLNSSIQLLKMRDAVTRLMDKCEKITERMATLVEHLTLGSADVELIEQPKNISKGCLLTQFQLIGLNWLVLMHRQNLNGVLADEMGLGKTIQVIAFLAHLREMGDEGPHLIVVPASTMDNWIREFNVWCPSIKILHYYGSQDERRHMRMQIVEDQVDYYIIITSYRSVISSPEDRVLFRKMDFHYVIFDEAHMLKNMATDRYDGLMRVQASRKILLTGTPLQNSLLELMSLLVFVMPDLFAKKKEELKRMFSMFPKTNDDGERSQYEKNRIAHAKRIMRPFFLRRLKADVLTDLPQKTITIKTTPMTASQHKMYFDHVALYKKKAQYMSSQSGRNKTKPNPGESGVSMLMNLRKIANHPLLVRNHFDDSQLRILARLLKQDSSHRNATEQYIFEDLQVMSDFAIHKTCLAFSCIEHYSLGNHLICNSGKFQLLDDMLPQFRMKGNRVLIFSQFVIVLNILEQYLQIRKHKYLRLDGSTPILTRQDMIDQFNTDESIFLFIISTKAGGLGINLTGADVVILHDLDFNPHNDKQAEDRCHRVGQTKPVRVYRLVSDDTIEKGIYTVAQEKLSLEQELSCQDDDGETTYDKKTVRRDVSRLLKIALDVEITDVSHIGDVRKVYSED